MFERNSSVPTWVWGLLVALILILISSRGSLAPNNPALQQVFAPQPTPVGQAPSFTLPQLDLGSLPAELQTLARDVSRQVGLGQSAAPIAPSARSARLLVEVREIRRVEAGIQIIGQVQNISTGEVRVPISAFELRDSMGASYIAGGGASATLAPNEVTPLDLTVPLPAGRGLLLVTNLPPDLPVEQILLATDL
jgi:hypothetical protein